MPWFSPKKIKLVVADKELEKGIRAKSYNYIMDLAISRDLPYIAALIREGKLSANFLQAIVELLKLEEGNTLFRGISPRQYKDFLEHGNTKNPENINEDEAYKLSRYGLNPSDVLYADKILSKAWEYVWNNNPSIIILYNGDMLEMVPGEWYLYKLKKGNNFNDAVKAYVIIWYR